MDESDFRRLPPRPDLADMLRGFESLGVSCELGLIQRHCGVEQPGLFRFGHTPLRGLLDGLESGFDGVGDPRLIDAHEDPLKEWLTTHRRYGFEFHTAQRSPQVGKQEVIEKMSVHFRYLARKLLEEIEDGAKVLVYRAEDEADAGALAPEAARSIAKRGRAPLLWVMAAPEAALAGTARWVEPGRLMFGYLDRYAPMKFAAAASYDCWLTLLHNAARLAVK